MHLDRKILFLIVLFGVVGVCYSARADSGTTSHHGRRITCASDDGGRHFCRIRTGGGVRMTNQRSHSACIEGRTWGYDDSGIWVDHGCRADFIVDVGQRTGPPMRPPMNLVRCDSDNGKRHFCPANTNRGVRLVNQKSGSPCVQGSTWGFDGQGIWVDHGCRAEFALGR